MVSTATIRIDALARAASVSFDQRFSSLSAPIAPDLADTVQIEFTLGAGEKAKTVQVNVSSATTLTSLVEAINNTVPGVHAAVVNAGSGDSPQYVLTIGGTLTGADQGKLAVTVPVELASAGILAGQNVQQAQDAVINVSGIGEARRPNNTVTGLLPGITLELKRQGSSTTIAVRDDSEKTGSRFREIVDSFNHLAAFLAERNLIESTEEDGDLRIQYGELAKTRVDDQLMRELREALLNSKSSTEGAVRSFSDAGLATERNGQLKFDEKAFAAAAAKDAKGLDSILRAFSDKVSTTGGVIDNFTKFRGQIEVAKAANDTENQSLNDRIARAEVLIQRQAEILKKNFAALESTIGKLNSDGDSLLSMLQGLNPLTSGF
jgi:flagellar hook-associated protein 2